jgi:hypothetical protein
LLIASPVAVRTAADKLRSCRVIVESSEKSYETLMTYITGENSGELMHRVVVAGKVRNAGFAFESMIGGRV